MAETRAKTEIAATTKAKRNKVGQKMRTKGLDTRRRIIDQTIQLLRDCPPHKLAAADVARACGLTPPALYLYFDGVPEVVLARLEELMAETPAHMMALDQLWDDDAVAESSTCFLLQFADYYQAHEPELRYRNVMADSGDDRFKKMRVDMTRPIAMQLADRIRTLQNDGRIPAHLKVLETAGAAMTIIEHSAAFAHSPYGSWTERKWDTNEYLKSSAYLLASLVKPGEKGDATC